MVFKNEEDNGLGIPLPAGTMRVYQPDSSGMLQFSGEDRILVVTKSGHFRTCNFDISNHFEDDVLIIQKFRKGKIWSAAYFDADQKYYYLKRFHMEPSSKSLRFIGEHPESRLIRITEVEYPRLELRFGGKSKDRGSEIIEVAEFIGIKSYKARGKRLSNYEVKVIEELEPMEVKSPDSKSEAEPPADGKSESAGAKSAKATGSVDKAKAQKSKAQKLKAQKSKAESRKSKADKQDPDEVPLEVIKPKEEGEGQGNDKKDKGNDKKDKGQFTLEW
jgi:topoisomerase-4 subunit A